MTREAKPGRVTERERVWSERAEAYRTSEAHREGADLDLLVEWAAGSGTALDVATGGGHVARRFREAGVEVVTVDSAPGMQPDVVSRAEDLPFAEASFDVVACRVAAHHFEAVEAAVRELARVARRLVLLVDNLFLSDSAEEADRLRDPSHVRNYSEAEWMGFFAAAGLRVAEVRTLEQPLELEPWLERAGCSGEEAQRVRTLLLGGSDETHCLPPGRASRPGAASSVAPIVPRYRRSLRPCLETSAPRRRATFRQTLLADRLRSGWVTLPRIALKDTKA